MRLHWFILTVFCCGLNKSRPDLLHSRFDYHCQSFISHRHRQPTDWLALVQDCINHSGFLSFLSFWSVKKPSLSLFILGLDCVPASFLTPSSETPLLFFLFWIHLYPFYHTFLETSTPPFTPSLDFRYVISSSSLSFFHSQTNQIIKSSSLSTQFFFFQKLIKPTLFYIKTVLTPFLLLSTLA